MNDKNPPFRMGKIQGGIFLFLYSVLIILTAPYVGFFRDYLWGEHRELYEPILRTVFYICTGLFLFYCLRTIRDKILERYLWLIGIIAFLAAGMWVLRTSMSSVNLIEKIHLVEYGLLGIAAFGFFRNFSFRRIIHFYSILFVFLVAICDEAFQHVLAIRTGEFRDVLINLLAGITSQLFIILVVRPAYLKGRTWRIRLPEFFTMMSLLILMVGSFIYYVQSGYLIQTGAGAFYSYHAPEELLEVNRRKKLEGMARMQEQLKTQEGLWALEDFYLTEAKRHLNRRNFLASLNDLEPAYCENTILEKYYSAHLEFTGSRWDDQTLKKLRRRIQMPRDFFYRSDVLNNIFVSLGKRTILIWSLMLVFCSAGAAVGSYALSGKR